ncbi:MAG: tRNA (adenosine(37)-N6)-dimethylallyltransferase MiaA [Legionella sp.]|jgi:tRNA dimethylallyltransferase|nr:tRNA (adenosine(37)-N6)-dimethylallyltransferase MiaA [Legionella sp.]
MRDVICLMGPTASGKTSLACELVKHLPYEIISVDSAMIYRDMNIGTAKPEADILQQAPHRLIDICSPTASYSAAQFCDDANQAGEEILNAGKTPLLVGGTMMYFRAFQEGLSVLPEANPEVREKIACEARDHSWVHMHQKLAKLDPITAARLHPNDTQRIGRALEVYALTGQPLSDILGEARAVIPYRFINMILFPEQRAWLHERIARRFDEMLALGFLDEVDMLLARWDLTREHPSMRSVGYRQALDYRAGMCDYSAFREHGIAATRQLAKRQLTWLRSWPHAYYFDPEKPGCLEQIMEFLTMKHKGIDND